MKSILIFLLFISLGTNAQTVINYANLSGTTCIFTATTDVPATINTVSGNVKHLATVGQINNGTVNSALYFESNSTGPVGSEFRIEYSFKQNYSYSIVINTRSINNSGDVPKLRLKITSGTGSSASCNGPQTIDGTLTSGGALTDYRGINNGNFNNISYTFNSIPSANTYLTIANIPSSNGGFQTIEIAKITITETAPAVIPPSFTLPSSITVACGSTTAQTFTVTNVNNTTGVTAYNWNLGSANNGWLHNGSAAPQTISTGTSNTLTLTPVCGFAQSSVSATVTANGTNYNTNTTAISITQPTLSINGSSSFCSGNLVYSIDGLPCNSTVNWAINPLSGIVTVAQNNNQATLTKTSNGQVTLTATITSCGTQTTRNITIDVGNPVAPQFIEIYGNGATDPLSLCPGSYHAEAFTSTTFPQYEWLLPQGWSSSVSGGSNPFITGSSGFDIPITVSTLPSTDYMRVRTLNGCGYSDPVFLEVGTTCGGYGFYVISPNPTKDNISIDGSNKKKKIKEVQLIDKLGNVKKRAIYSGNTELVNFTISGFASDIYYLKIFDGKKWESKKIKIQ